MNLEQMSMVQLIDEAYKTKEELTIAKYAAKQIEDKFDLLEAEILSRATNNNIKTMGTDIAKISVSESVVPTIEDWDATLAHIVENKAFYLLKRSVNSGPFAEINAAGGSIPGVAPFTKLKLSLRKA